MRARSVAVVTLTLGIVLVAALASGFLGGRSASSAPTAQRPGGRSRASLPFLRVTRAISSRLVVPGARPVLSWPAHGQGAVAVLGEGAMASSPSEQSVPIASLTKMMTAYLVLADHPLLPGQSGPTIRITSADVADYVYDSKNDLSNVAVAAGEELTERQLLEALLIPSGDNIADLLARWDAGSIPAFVAKMNAEARALGLDGTHYADASGVDPGSRSTAADQARLASLLMGSPVVRSIVRLGSLAFPVVGRIWNYNPALGVDGIVGVKSGFTSEAKGCLVTAAFRDVGGTSVLVVVAALGQPDGLDGAARADEALLSSASRALVAFPIVGPGARVGVVRPTWSRATAGLRAPEDPAPIVAWPGLALTRSIEVGAKPPASLRVGSTVATLAVAAPLGEVARVPLSLTSTLPPAPAGSTAAAG